MVFRLLIGGILVNPDVSRAFIPRSVGMWPWPSSCGTKSVWGNFTSTRRLCDLVIHYVWDFVSARSWVAANPDLSYFGIYTDTCCLWYWNVSEIAFMTDFCSHLYWDTVHLLMKSLLFHRRHGTNRFYHIFKIPCPNLIIPLLRGDYWTSQIGTSWLRQICWWLLSL